MPMGFIRGYEHLTSFVGYLNIEMYQVFWVLILGILIAYLAASLISEELEAKTIDMLMSNPVSREKGGAGEVFGITSLDFDSKLCSSDDSLRSGSRHRRRD